MRHVIVLAIVLAASSAAAQSMDSKCRVTIARAPDDVRNVVESWVKAEPTCTVSLELRIVRTEGGLYLLARDEFGRVRERVVPDAQSAGVLVASWIATDTHEGQTPYDIRQPPAAAPAAPAAIGGEQAYAPEASAPSMAPVIAKVAPRADRPRWLAIGGVFGMSGTGGGGVRVEYDWRQKGWATLGFVASASASGMQIYGPTWDSMATLDTFDGKLLGYAAVGVRSQRWQLRSSLGVGAVYTAATLRQQYSSEQADGLFLTGELTASISRDLGDNWALAIGPVVSLYAQQYLVEFMGPGYYSSSTERRDLDVKMFIAARYRL